MDLNTYHNKDKGIKIYSIRKNKPLSWLLFRDQLTWILNAVKNWVVPAENYPLMSLPTHLVTKHQEPVNQFGYLYKQEREWTQAGARFRGGGGGGGEGREGNSNYKRDQLTLDVNQQLTWSQFRGPEANKVIASEH